jgi:uncharacterized protein (DUF362 family)
MSEKNQIQSSGRRNFFKLLTAGGAGFILSPIVASAPVEAAGNLPSVKPATNIQDALKFPRNANSMPGLFPGAVTQVNHTGCIKDKVIQQKAVDQMLTSAMLNLTGKKSVKKAWRKFVKPHDIVGLKVNPVAGKLLTTSHELVKAVIAQLETAGIPRKNIVIWDRREMELHETGFLPENYPGITISGTEQKDAKGSFFDGNGKLYGEGMIDKEWSYWADVEGTYDEYTMPYMVNGGKHSYFTKICTKQVTKIINLPILKNAGGSVTLCLKNLAYGAISNTGRLHEKLWHDSVAEVCAFPPLRDKVVLNIVDGLIGCYNGGPAANPQFICQYNLLLVGSDPVAVDRVGLNIVSQKRIDMKLQKEESPVASQFLKRAEELGLGIGDNSRINKKTIDLA